MFHKLRANWSKEAPRNTGILISWNNLFIILYMISTQSFSNQMFIETIFSLSHCVHCQNLTPLWFSKLFFFFSCNTVIPSLLVLWYLKSIPQIHFWTASVSQTASYPFPFVTFLKITEASHLWSQDCLGPHWASSGFPSPCVEFVLQRSFLYHPEMWIKISNLFFCCDSQIVSKKISVKRSSLSKTENSFPRWPFVVLRTFFECIDKN